MDFAALCLKSILQINRLEPLLKFNFTLMTPSLHPKTPFLELGSGMGLILASLSHICLLTGNLLPDFQITLNSLNFEAKINFNTTKENCLKCRAKCTGLKLNLGPLNGPHTQI